MSTSFKINRVYTRSGDDGLTGLVGGDRVAKDDVRVIAYGEIDELNASIGVARCELPAEGELSKLLLDLQQQLFDLGSELATPSGVEYPGMWKADASHVKRLEELCDHYGANLPELHSFILPGGERAAAAFHVIRTVARRAERSLVTLANKVGEGFNWNTVQYINRISDLFFILARYQLKQAGVEQPIWVKEAERKI